MNTNSLTSCMETYETLTDAINGLKAKGYLEDFNGCKASWKGLLWLPFIYLQMEILIYNVLILNFNSLFSATSLRRNLVF